MRNIGERFVVSCFIIFALFFSICGQKKSDREQSDYHGAVKNVRTEIIEYSFENGKLKAGKRKLESTEQFDKSGNLLERVYYGSDEKLLWSDKNVFSKGRLVETITNHSPFTFLPDKRIYKYDNAGNLIEENGYNLSGKLVNQSVYVYDEQNRKTQDTSVSYHPEEHSKPHRWTYSYDEQGRLKEEKTFSNEGNGFVPTDSLGRPHRKLLIYRNGNKSEVDMFFKVNGQFARMTLTTYDRRGNEIEDVKYDENGNVKEKARYEYKFDRLGNWLEQKTYEWETEDGKSFYRLSEISYQIINFFIK
jgi:YD repeat-containing protein